MSYPTVMTEEETLTVLLEGKFRGLARYGDGDMNILRGRADRYHFPCPKLAAHLAETLRHPCQNVLNALIPPPLPTHSDLAHQRWLMYLEANAGIHPFLPGALYGSSNISRMDSVPHLHTTSWWLRVSELWRDKDICIVSGSERSLTPLKLSQSPQSPRSITSVGCKPRDNYSQLSELYEAILRTERETVILCSGLVTRPLVHKLVEAGLKAYDLGHLGLWFDKGHAIPLPDCPR
jgi:hypothetical protein